MILSVCCWSGFNCFKNAKGSGFQTAKSCFCLNSRFQHVKRPGWWAAFADQARFGVGLALKRFQPLHWSGFNRYIEAVLTATLKPINRHQQTYSQIFVIPLPKYKPKRQVTDTKCIWFHLGPLFLVFHYEVHTVVTNWNALQAEKQKQNSRRSQCCRVLIEMHFRLNTRRNRFIELS